MSLRYRKKLAGDQPKDLNAKTFAPNAGNIRQTKRHTEILGFLGESAQNARSITFHVIYNRYTILDWNHKKSTSLLHFTFQSFDIKPEIILIKAFAFPASRHFTNAANLRRSSIDIINPCWFPPYASSIQTQKLKTIPIRHVGSSFKCTFLFSFNAIMRNYCVYGAFTNANKTKTNMASAPCWLVRSANCLRVAGNARTKK